THIKDLPNFGSLFGFDHRLKTLEANFSKFVQTNQFAGAVSSIPVIVEIYMDQRMNEAVKVAVQIQTKRLRDEAQAENEEFLNNLDKNIQKIIKDQVKEQVKIILDIYGDRVTLKRRRDDVDKDEKPSAGSDRGSKRRRGGKEPESTSAPKEKATKITGKSTQGSKSHHKTASESAPVEELMQTTQDLEEPSHQKEFETGAADDQPIAEAFQHPEWFQQQKKPPTPNRAWNKTLPTTHGSIQLWINTLSHELLAGPTYELMKGSCKSLVELEFFLEEVYRETTDQLDWNNPEGQESARDVYSKRIIIAVIELEIVEWHDYKHLDWITVRRDDDKLYKFKEGDFKRLRIQDIEDMLLLLGIQMKYLPQAIWRKSDKERAVAMIQAIDKQLKTRWIMRSLKKFVGGRLYEGDFRMLQRTI
nr:hypothetical protein [Tanacetum cinerariifolium]